MTRNEKVRDDIYGFIFTPYSFTPSKEKWNEFFKANIGPLLKEDPDEEFISHQARVYKRMAFATDEFRTLVEECIAYGRNNPL